MFDTISGRDDAAVREQYVSQVDKESAVRVKDGALAAKRGGRRAVYAAAEWR